MSMRVLLLGAAVLVSSGLHAGAADMYGGSIKDAPVYAPVAPSPSIYFRVDGGYAFNSIGDVDIVDQGLVNAPSTFTTPGSDIDDSWSIGAGVGRNLGMGFRGDLTLEYRTSADVTGTAEACCSLGTKTDVDGVVGLANLYYDFNRGSWFTPYIGAGIGFAHLSTGSGTLGCVSACGANFGDATYDGSSTTNFAVAAMAGASLKLRGGDPVYAGGMKDAPVMVESGRALYLDVGYRFLYLGDVEAGNAVQTNGNELDVGWDSLKAHEVRVGLRYELR